MIDGSIQMMEECIGIYSFLNYFSTFLSQQAGYDVLLGELSVCLPFTSLLSQTRGDLSSSHTSCFFGLTRLWLFSNNKNHV